MLASDSSRNPDAQRLREKHYNASVESIRRCHAELMIVRVRPDGGIPLILPGQYAVLGLGSWEPGRRNASQRTKGTVFSRS